MITVKFIEKSPIRVVFTTNGADGVGVPAGGTTGQVLKKSSDTSYDTEWADESGGGGGGSVDSVTGTADRIVITGTATDPVIDIAAAYDAAITAEIAAATLTQRYVCGTNINSSVTGTATETLISTVEMVIPANTMTANSMLTIIALFNRVSAGGITTIKWGFNTSYAIAGTVFVSNANMTAAVRGVELHFNVFTNNALNSTKWNLAVSFSSATANSNGVTTVGTIDWSVDQYLIITTTSAVAGENTTMSAVRVYIDKA